MYYPYTLPARAAQCPYEEMISHRDKRGLTMHSQACGLATGPRGVFCQKHSFILEMLDHAAVLGYPEIEVNQYLVIGRGTGSWEAYALRHTPARHTKLLQKLHALILATKEQNAAALLTAIHNSAEHSQPGQEIGIADDNNEMYVPF